MVFEKDTINSFFNESYSKDHIATRIKEVLKGKVGFYSVGLYPASLAYNCAMQTDGNRLLLAPRPNRNLLGAFPKQIVDGMDQEGVNRGLGIVSASEIDKIGIVAATKLSMVQAVGKLKGRPDFLLIDAVDLEETGIDYKSIIKGDQTCLSIAAASIVAKVHRDNLMLIADQDYPGYGFSQHKGYPTKFHVQKLIELGPSPIHRVSFAPVRRYIGDKYIQE